jgi:purine-binding chemotaxis protein CheW
VNESRQGLIERAAELREAFDRSFALPLADAPETGQMFLILGVGAERYVMAIDTLLGIEHHRKIVPLPLRAAGLLGLAGFRGQLAPVFSLASLLGSAGGPEMPTWLAFCKGPTPVAIAFDRLEGAVRFAGAEVHAAEAKGSPPRLTKQMVRVGSNILSVIDVPSLIEAAKRSLAGSR